MSQRGKGGRQASQRGARKAAGARGHTNRESAGASFYEGNAVSFRDSERSALRRGQVPDSAFRTISRRVILDVVPEHDMGLSRTPPPLWPVPPSSPANRRRLQQQQRERNRAVRRSAPVGHDAYWSDAGPRTSSSPKARAARRSSARTKLPYDLRELRMALDTDDAPLEWNDVPRDVSTVDKALSEQSRESGATCQFEEMLRSSRESLVSLDSMDSALRSPRRLVRPRPLSRSSSMTSLSSGVEEVAEITYEPDRFIQSMAPDYQSLCWANPAFENS